MIISTSPLHAVYRLIEQHQYEQALALANYYPQSSDRRALDCIVLLMLGRMDRAAALMPSTVEELTALVVRVKTLSSALHIGWETLNPRVHAKGNSYLTYLCLNLIDRAASELGYALRTLARHGMQADDWQFATLCLEHAIDVDGSPLGLLEATKLAIRIEADPAGGNAWHGPSAGTLLTEALSHVNREDARADLFPDGAFLLLTLNPTAEDRAKELIQQAREWFPDQRSSILAACVRLATQAISGERLMLATQIAKIGADLVRNLLEYVEVREISLYNQLESLVKERHVYREASWYKEGQERETVLRLLEHARVQSISGEILHLIGLSVFPDVWRAEWVIYALERGARLSGYNREKVLRWADTLPNKYKEAILGAAKREEKERVSTEISGDFNLIDAGSFAGFDRGFADAIQCSRIESVRLSVRRSKKPQKLKTRRVERYTRVQFPETCKLEKKVDFKLQLTARRPAVTRVSRKVAVIIEGDAKEIDLTVILTAPGFATDSPARTMKMPVEGDSEEVVFPLFPLTKGAKSLEVEVFHGAERVTYLLVRTVVESSADVSLRSLLREIDRDSDAKAGNDRCPIILEQYHLSLNDRLRKPLQARSRRMLHVTWRESEGKLNYRVISPLARDEYAEEHLNLSLHGTVCDELRKLNEFLFDVVTYERPTDDEWEALQLNLHAKGLTLAELLLPPGLRAQISQWPAGSTLVIDTNEQWIPWEILHDGVDFLGLRFVLARAPRYIERAESLQSVRRQSRPRRVLSRVVNVVGGEVEKKHADRAARIFKRFSPPLQVATLREKPVSALEKALPGADALHLTCHGHVEPHLLQVAKTSSQALNLLPDSVRVLSLKRGSMVFANSCESDRALVMFGNFTSFGWEFYRRGADVFIGTLGAVPTVHAVYFAEQLYTRLFQSAGSAIGEIVREARCMAETKRNLFSLLYCLYGDPDTVVTCAGGRDTQPKRAGLDSGRNRQRKKSGHPATAAG